MYLGFSDNTMQLTSPLMIPTRIYHQMTSLKYLPMSVPILTTTHIQMNPRFYSENGIGTTGTRSCSLAFSISSKSSGTQTFIPEMWLALIGDMSMLNWLVNILATSKAWMAGRTNQIWEDERRPQSRLIFPFISEHFTRGQKNSILESSIITSWHLWFGSSSPGPQTTLTSTLNLTSSFCNSMILLGRSESMVNSIHQMLFFKRIMKSKIPSGNQDATSHMLSSVWCLPPMALSSQLSAMPNCGQFTLCLEMSPRISDQNPLAMPLSTLLIWKRFV